MPSKRAFPVVPLLAVALCAAFALLERRRDAAFRDAVAEARQKSEADVAAVRSEYVGYWPRLEAATEALDEASNRLARAAADLAAEREASAPLRKRYEALSAERIAQDARETDLRKRTEAAEQELASNKGRLDDIVAKHLAAESKRRELEEGLHARDVELARLREELQNVKVELSRLEEANRCVPELQNENASVKRERDEARQALDAEKAKAEAQRKELDELVRQLRAEKDAAKTATAP